MSDDDNQYYFSLKTHRVVRADEEKSEDRLGPYATYADAQAAMKRVNERNEDWESDPRWNDDDDPDAVNADGSPKQD